MAGSGRGGVWAFGFRRTAALRGLIVGALVWLNPAVACGAGDGASAAEMQAPDVLSTAGEFTLIKGAGRRVCEAYTERLNRSSWQRIDGARCGRPENDEVSGFRMLNRVPLTRHQFVEINDLSSGFWGSRDQDRVANEQARGLSFCARPGFESACVRWRQDAAAHEAWRQKMVSGVSDFAFLAWQYDPRIDIDNDSTPDNVVFFSTNAYCRSEFPTPAQPLILDSTNARIDEVRTQATFGHPAPRRVPMETGFVPIGAAFGVFVFEGEAYFDAFYTWRGDIHGERSQYFLKNAVLAVFQRKNAVTREVCRIRWNELK